MILPSETVVSIPTVQVGAFFVFGGRHFERGDLLGQYRDGFDGHCDRPSEPPEPPAIGNDQLDLALGAAHDLLDTAERHIVIVQHRQADQIADLDLLGEAPRHLGFEGFILEPSFGRTRGFCCRSLLRHHDMDISRSCGLCRGTGENRHPNDQSGRYSYGYCIDLRQHQHPFFFVISIASSSVAAVTTVFTSSPLSSMMQLTR